MKHTSIRKEQIFRDAAAEFVARSANRNSLITITRAIVDDAQHTVDILVTVLPEQQEQAVIDFLTRNITEFKQYLYEHTRIGRVPLISFHIDLGDKNRQRVEELI